MTLDKIYTHSCHHLALFCITSSKFQHRKPSEFVCKTKISVKFFWFVKTVGSESYECTFNILLIYFNEDMFHYNKRIRVYIRQYGYNNDAF